MDILIQLIGFAAAAAGVASFLIKDVKRLYITQASSSALFILQFFMLGGYSGSALIIVDMIRSIGLSTGKPFVKTKAFLAIIFLMCIAAFFIASEDLKNPITYLTLIASMTCAAAFWTRNSKLIRLAQLIVVSPLWLVYSIFTNSIGGAVSQALMMVASAVFLIKERNKSQLDL